MQTTAPFEVGDIVQHADESLYIVREVEHERGTVVCGTIVETAPGYDGRACLRLLEISLRKVCHADAV